MEKNNISKNQHYRFFVDSNSIVGDFFISQDKELIHQIKNVFRLKKDSEVLILDNNSNEYLVKISEITNKISANIVNRKKHNQPKSKINLFCSFLKGSNFEVILQKSTELGINEITPVIFQNSLIRFESDKKINRWNKILKEASEQSMRNKIPKLNPTVTFDNIVNKKSEGINLAAIKESKINLLNYSSKIKKNNLVNLFIGPEGDFSENEKKIMEEKGFLFYNLGPNTLRSETACLLSIGLISQIML